MAINKKLIHFKNKENFDNEVANGNILDNSIIFIQDSKEISTHGTVYKTVNWSVLESKFATFKVVHCGADTPTEYTFIEGMTWGEFCDSPEFNIDIWWADEYSVNTYDLGDPDNPWGYYEWRWLVANNDIQYDESVNINALIVPGYTYYEHWYSSGIGGGSGWE